MPEKDTYRRFEIHSRRLDGGTGLDGQPVRHLDGGTDAILDGRIAGRLVGLVVFWSTGYLPAVHQPFGAMLLPVSAWKWMGH